MRICVRIVDWIKRPWLNKIYNVLSRHYLDFYLFAFIYIYTCTYFYYKQKKIFNLELKKKRIR